MPFSRYLHAARAARYLSLASTALASGAIAGACTDSPVAPVLARTDRLIDHTDLLQPWGGTPWQGALDSAVAAAVADASAGDVLALQHRIARAADGLLYTSESDYPFTYVRSATALATADGSPADPAEVIALFGVAPTAAVQRITLDEFFARHIERVDLSDEIALARVRDYVRLRETLRHALDQVHVYRIGTIAVECLVVGFDRHGHAVGVRTVSIET